jgi:hypothetical protein
MACNIGGVHTRTDKSGLSGQEDEQHEGAMRTSLNTHVSFKTAFGNAFCTAAIAGATALDDATATAVNPGCSHLRGNGQA